MNNQLQAIATLLSLVNPVICGMLFVGVEAGRSRLQQLADATKAILAISLILVAIGVATGVTWLVMLVVARFSSHQGHPGFVRDTMTRFMGLIVLSMGVQFALTGYHTFETGQVLR